VLARSPASVATAPNSLHPFPRPPGGLRTAASSTPPVMAAGAAQMSEVALDSNGYRQQREHLAC